ncbi:transcription factor TFIIIB component B'' homolog isoform X2 [Danio aesculapii]|uniref:transcription factor TFIIIB component B'' homolog isoform X2 n=1 Tax=Danio aesculapii TaxID=1142201 RepID=UPI0024C0DEC7|nr:transcription factor TFIIIB component B'' homolog isoform X2 [Danio aesculapii]
MMRRSRISVRPNVKPTGRAPTASREASAENAQASQSPADSAPSEGSEVTAEKLNTDPSIAAPEQTNEEASQSSSPSDQLEDAKRGEDASFKISTTQDSASTSLTSGPPRRKRFTALPNLAKPRASASARTPKSPIKCPVKPVTPNEPEKSTTNAEIPAPVHNPRVPARRRPSGGSRPAKSQPISPESLQNDGESQKHGALQEVVVPLTVQEEGVGTISPPDTVSDENESRPTPIVEEIVVQQESGPGAPLDQSQTDLLKEKLQKLKSPSKIIKSLTAVNDPADMIRLAQARKLRELLKKEMVKDKEDKKKPKMGLKERKAPKDHTKMTMRDLIYYLPVSNPMKSFTEEEQKASETVLDDSPTPISSNTPDPPAVEEPVAEDADPEEDEERTEEAQAEDKEPLLVPRVKVAEDGSLIIDEESLTVQVLRANGPNPAEDRDPIFERGSTTTYSSFRKGTYTKPWSNGETEMFFLAISMVGTDFSMIGQLFPHRARLEIKNKFKKEEKNNAWRIDKAFKEKRRLDLDFFKKLMEQIQNDEEEKKNKSKALFKLAKAQRKARVVKRKEMDSSEDSDSDVVAGEKENEDLSNDGGGVVTPKRRRGRAVKNTDRGIKRTYGEVDNPEDCENVTSDTQSPDDRLKDSDSSENINKSPSIKPAQLKGRPQKMIPNISRRWGDRRPKNNIQEDKTSAEDPLKVPSASKEEKEKKQPLAIIDLIDLDEEPDLSAVQEQIFNKPTRSGRIPKLSQHVIQAAAEEEEEDEEELSDHPTSSKVCVQAPGRRAKIKPGPRLKQGMQRRGKSRLVTLLASGAEDDDDDEREEAEGCILSQEDFPSNLEEENQAFVPMSLRPQAHFHSEVVETMEELDISVNVPDILSASHNALCPESACEQAVFPAGAVPYEHQLDLLVDVIEFLDPEHMEVCKEINNEAAQTLLTIGNSAQMIQTSEIPCLSGHDIMHEEIAHEEVITETAIMSDPSISCHSEMRSDVELSNCETQIPEPPISIEEPIKSQNSESHPDPVQQDSHDLASTFVPPPTRGRFAKPKPNIGLKSRRAPQQQFSSELSADSVENLKGGLSSTEQDKNETLSTQEVSDELSDSSNIHPEVQQPDSASGRNEDAPERLTEEDGGSVVSLKRNDEDKITEEKIKDEDAKSHPVLINSENESQSTLDEAPKPVRRNRGPKPKPNLTQPSRKKHTQTQLDTHNRHNTSVTTGITFSKSPEEGAVITTEPDVSQRAAQQEVTLSLESTQAGKDTSPVVSEDDSRPNTVVMLDEEQNRTAPDEAFGESSVKPSRCESKDAPEEPAFILSLTEIPPTLQLGACPRAEPLPPTTEPESHSHGQSVKESKEVSHILLMDALVPVSEEEEREREEEDKSRRGQLKRKTPSSTSQESTKSESQAEHCVGEVSESLVAEETDQHLEKKRQPPERTRRAKLQVKPIPVMRRNTQGTKEDTTALTLKETTSSLPISTPETRPEQTDPTVISASATSDNIPSSGESVQADSSQDIMGHVDLPVKETDELASGSEPQAATQITPAATSGPLTRPGRRPKGFLSFISPKITQGPPTRHRGSKPAVNTARPDRKQVAAASTNPGRKQALPTPASTTERSEDEPTSVSKYFFSDIFTEVDELEDMD